MLVYKNIILLYLAHLKKQAILNRSKTYAILNDVKEN